MYISHRRGIPINQRGTVWKAIIDNRIRGSRERPQPEYYQVQTHHTFNMILKQTISSGTTLKLQPRITTFSCRLLNNIFVLVNYNIISAKQIELDLLRTLTSNKHYDGPHAPF